MSQGKIEELIKQKRSFLRQAKPEYANGGGDMLDDVEAALREAKEEMAHNLQLASVLSEEDEAEWQKECLGMYVAWFEKWLGKQ
jgi:hypothetical protein